MNNRTKRFDVGDAVSDLNGRKGTVQEAHCDPHPPEFSHCLGNSARYLVLFDGRTAPSTVWDWQLSPAPVPDLALLPDDPAPTLEEAVGLVNDFKRRFPLVANFLASCKPSSTTSASTNKGTTTPPA